MVTVDYIFPCNKMKKKHPTESKSIVQTHMSVVAHILGKACYVGEMS